MSIIKQDYGSFQDMATQHMLAPILQNLVNTTGAVISAGSYFIFNNELYKATADIAANATIVIGTTSGCNANYAKTITEEMMNQEVPSGTLVAGVQGNTEDITASPNSWVSTNNLQFSVPSGYSLYGCDATAGGSSDSVNIMGVSHVMISSAGIIRISGYNSSSSNKTFKFYYRPIFRKN